MKKYSSKIGWWWIPFFICYIVVLAILISKKTWFSLYFGACLLLIMYTFFNTYYVIKEQKLLVKSGILYSKWFEINEIICIEKYKGDIGERRFNVSLSRDRIKIAFQNGGNVIISPKNKEAFIKDLLKINSNISVKKEY